MPHLLILCPQRGPLECPLPHQNSHPKQHPRWVNGGRIQRSVVGRFLLGFHGEAGEVVPNATHVLPPVSGTIAGSGSGYSDQLKILNLAVPLLSLFPPQGPSLELEVIAPHLDEYAVMAECPFVHQVVGSAIYACVLETLVRGRALVQGPSSCVICLILLPKFRTPNPSHPYPKSQALNLCSVALNNDSSVIAAGNSDRSIRLWETSSGVQLGKRTTKPASN